MICNRIVEIKYPDEEIEYMVCREIVSRPDYGTLALCEDEDGDIRVYRLNEIRFVDGDANKMISEYLKTKGFKND